MGIPRYVRLLLRPPALSLEEAWWELVHTLTEPYKMYRSLYIRHETRNRWAREDPSFIIYFFVLLCLSALLWGLTYAPNFSSIIKLFWWMVLVEFVAVGLVVSTAAYMLVNKYGQKPTPHEPLEWAYCFDVHCNSFVSIYFWLYLVAYILSPMILHQNYWIAIIMGNLLYFIAIVHYAYITFLGYSTLPFVKNTEVIFSIAPFAFLTFLVCTVSRFSIPVFMAQHYLHWHQEI